MKRSGSKNKSGSGNSNKNASGGAGGSPVADTPQQASPTIAEAAVEASAAVTTEAGAPAPLDAMAAGPVDQKTGPTTEAKVEAKIAPTVETAAPARSVGDAGNTDAKEAATSLLSEAEADAARVRADAARDLSEAEKLAEQLRAEADQYWQQMQKTVEETRASLVAEAEEARSGLEQELVELRRSSQADIDKMRIPGLATSLDALDKARVALESNSEKFAVGLASLSSIPPLPPDVGMSSGHDLSLDSRDMFSVRRPASDAAAAKASDAEESEADAAALRTGRVRTSKEAPWGALAPPWTPGHGRPPSDADFSDGTERSRPASSASRGLVLFTVAASLVVGALVLGTLHEVSEVKAALDEQRVTLARLGEVHTTTAAIAAVPIAAPPTAVVEKPAPAPSAAAPAAAPTVDPVANAAAKPEVPAHTEEARATISDEDMNAIQKILGNRSLTDWRKKRFILAGRRALKVSKIHQEELDKLIETVNSQELPAVTLAEVEDLKKIHRAQTTLIACKVLDGGLDLQLGAGTRTKLKEAADGVATCASTTDSDIAAFSSLKADLASSSWKDFLADDRTMQLVQTILK